MPKVDKREKMRISQFFDPPGSREMRNCKFFAWMLEHFNEQELTDHDWMRRFLDSEGYDPEKHIVPQSVLDVLKGVFSYAWARYKVERNKHRWQDLLKPINVPTDREQIAEDANCYRIQMNLPGIQKHRSYIWFELLQPVIDLFETEPAPWRLHPTAYNFYLEQGMGTDGELSWGTDLSGKGRAIATITNFDEMGQDVLDYIVEHKLMMPHVWEQDAGIPTQTHPS